MKLVQIAVPIPRCVTHAACAKTARSEHVAKSFMCLISVLSKKLVTCATKMKMLLKWGVKTVVTDVSYVVLGTRMENMYAHVARL